MQGRIHEHDNFDRTHVIAQPRFVRRPKSTFSTPSLEGTKTVRAIATALLVLAPSVALADCKSDLATLHKLLSQEPVASANAAIARGNLFFLGVAGYSVTVPGVESPKCSVLPNRIRVIEGTSDTPCGAEGARLQADTTTFAERYNAVVRAHLDRQHVKYAACAL